MHPTPMYNDINEGEMKCRKTVMMTSLKRVMIGCRKIACKLLCKILKMTPTRLRMC